MIRCFLSELDVTAVPALPHDFVGLFKDFPHFNGVQQPQEAILVGFLDGPHLPELICDVGKTFLFGDPGEILIHLRPFEMLAGLRVHEILCGVRERSELAEPEERMSFLVVGGFAEYRGYLLEALLLCGFRELVVLAARLGLPGECGAEVCLRACSFQIHVLFSFAFFYTSIAGS